MNSKNDSEAKLLSEEELDIAAGGSFTGLGSLHYMKQSGAAAAQAAVPEPAQPASGEFVPTKLNKSPEPLYIPKPAHVTLNKKIEDL